MIKFTRKRKVQRLAIKHERLGRDLVAVINEQRFNLASGRATRIANIRCAGEIVQLNKKQWEIFLDKTDAIMEERKRQGFLSTQLK